MNASQIYIAVSIAVLVIVVLLLFFVSKNRKENRLITPLTGLAFGFVLAGILFGEDRLIGYSLLGVGVLLAVIDMFTRLKRK